MAIRETLLPEFDHEIASTRKCLERLPADKFGYKPHDKSWTLQQLASHVATLTNWAVMTCNQDKFDLAAPSTPSPKLTTAAELVASLDDNSAKARAAIAATDDARMMEPWSLTTGDTVVFTMPRAAVLRTFVMNHLIHHRAQLTIYMRMIDVPMPGMYGPSADEKQ
jgi:uncharacterized damage-inducible protein DinB